jgi:hypothetical protein
MFLRESLATQELDGLGHVTELLADELVANVVRHVGSEAVVRLTRTASGIRVEVDDASTAEPVVQHPDIAQQSGRGMLMVDGCANRWGVLPRGDGKTVWFEIDATTAAREVHGDQGA